jgi:hypothetical protein
MCDTKNRFEKSNFNRLYLSPTLVKLILVNLPLLPDENTAEEAKLLPKTSLVVVKLAPICSISLLFPADSMIRFSLSTIHFPKVRI